MKKTVRVFFTSVFLMVVIAANGQNVYLEKTVTLTAGKTTLKDVLKTLSDQTGCVFSYDPTKVIDNKKIATPAGIYTLQSALQKILPQNIQFKMTGKYVVLQKFVPAVVTPDNKKQTTEPTRITVNKTENQTTEYIKENIANYRPDEKPQIIDVTDTTEIINSGNNTQTELVTETQNSRQIPDPVADIITTPPTKKDTVIPAAKPLIKSKSGAKKILESELAFDNHLGTLSIHWGLSSIYGSFSLGGDYNKSYHMGIGIGTGFGIYKRFGMNIELKQYALVAGRSRRVNIRAYTTQLSPVLNYKIGDHWKISLGPTFYTINSVYKNGSTTTNLGKYNGSGGIIGVSYNFKAL